ncbi:trimeric intracellular cation channel family protein [Granulicella cerasi]|uniref:Trimeric intracellular cation channel family protein n=1 Tax=Granulicella cerasi TaxID=741063 RepID=A0ABW1Z8C2_9BACT|nr:trimeric intracellular cation channel family protein [Granulicella cerasi]
MPFPFKRFRPTQVLLVFDLLATLLVALEGSSAGVLAHLDFFGVLVIAFISALGGGIVRDLLIGATPPNAIRDWRYGAIALLGGGITLISFQTVQTVPHHLLVTLDAAGLALFAVAGADKAIEYGVSPLSAVLMGATTGCGGGVIRDLLLNRIPAILHSDVYATAALAGAIVTVVSLRFRLPRGWAMAAGAVICFTLRMMAVTFGWSLPHVAGY